MGKKSKISYETKVAAVEAYERNEGSLKTVAEQFAVKDYNLEEWWIIYKSQGYEGLKKRFSHKQWKAYHCGCLRTKQNRGNYRCIEHENY